jgi:hypothetical protein
MSTITIIYILRLAQRIPHSGLRIPNSEFRIPHYVHRHRLRHLRR